MFSKIRYPDQVSPNELDLYLANGWRPLGQQIYTSHFHYFGNGRIFSTVCIRLPLQDYTFRKSLRKLFNKNRRRFRVETGPATANEEKNRLNLAYRKVHPKKSTSDLTYFTGNDQEVFDTWEINVFEEEDLVAFSYFDRGEKGIYSKAGIYDPEYASYSLGFYTMLEEIQFGIENGYEYYYPGYIVPGYPMFDYKLRIGDVEYLDIQSNKWKSIDLFDEAQIPLRVIESQLTDLKEILEQNGLTARFYYYQYFDLALYRKLSFNYFRFPAFLLCEAQSKEQMAPMIIYHPLKKKFQLIKSRFVNRYFDHGSCYEAYLNDPQAILCSVLIACQNTELTTDKYSEIIDWLSS